MSIKIDQSGMPEAAALEKLANELFRQGETAHSPQGLKEAPHPTAPPAAAGSGQSPAGVLQHPSFNFENPPTGFPDTSLLGSSHTPSPVGGASSVTQQAKEYPPYQAEAEQQFNLQSVFPLFPSGNTVAQLPALPEDVPSYYFFEQKLPPVNAWGFEPDAIKKDFPILSEYVNGKPLVWLDNAATTQKPRQVIERITYFYQHENSNIHRAAHELAARATDAYEAARKKVQQFIGAGSPNEIVFVRGATEGINLVAKSWGGQHLQPDDEIVITHLEHHANIVPWQQLAAQKGLKLRVAPVDDDGQILLEEYATLLNSKTKLVAFTQVSNALGTITPAPAIIEMAHQAGAKVLVDGAQSVSHMPTDVKALNADWFVFSGHKVFGPTGIGVLYGKEDLLNSMEPWQGGGNMIKEVTFEHTEYQQAPARFEAGTGNIADAVGLGAALDYVNKLGIDKIARYEHYLLEYATTLLKQVPGLCLVGTARDKASVLSFTLDGYSNDQVGQKLNKEGIAVRTGHHCAQPILRRYGLESTVRPSLAFYNTCADVDLLVSSLHQLASARH